jgi:hypothetical protein
VSEEGHISVRDREGERGRQREKWRERSAREEGHISVREREGGGERKREGEEGETGGAQQGAREKEGHSKP